jgi:hypothetical protein
MTAAADLIRGAAIGLAIGLVIAAVILVVRHGHSQPAVYVPTMFSPSPSAPCPVATLSPAPLRGRPDCAEATP